MTDINTRMPIAFNTQEKRKDFSFHIVKGLLRHTALHWGAQTKTYTIKLVYNDHPWDPKYSGRC
jgi:hypothetical protein